MIGKPSKAKINGTLYIQPPAKTTVSICKGCGKEFTHKVSSKAKYCECWFYRSPKIKTNCIHCGKEYYKWSKSKSKYCNRNCYWNHLKISLRGDKSHLWKGGLTKKSKKIRSRADYKEWRESVFIRDGYSCQECSVVDYKNKNRTLNAHHIKSFSKHPELRIDINNGITLCLDCHQKKHPQRLSNFKAGKKRFDLVTSQTALQL